MHEEMTFDAISGATIRLVNASWANYLQRVCHGLKSIGQACRGNNAEALIKRLRRTRPSTYAHSLRVAKYSRAAGQALGFNEARLQQLGHAAIMHDVGKIFIPESVLNRPRKLTPTEFFVLHKHPSFGAMLASYFKLPAELSVRTQHHHERWDGRGYPSGLAGSDIPLMARIVQVADTYDAMTSTDRPYRKPHTHAAAIAELRKEAGKQFDPRVVEAFTDAFTETISTEHFTGH
ncbi:MAG: HD-GYP domain-containing protein [Pyrinomonadaceae bacterium]